MLKITDLSLLKVGMWYTHCCHLDLKQIENEEELKELIEENSLGESENWAEFWENKIDALCGIYYSQAKSNSKGSIESLNKIHKMILNEIQCNHDYQEVYGPPGSHAKFYIKCTKCGDKKHAKSIFKNI